VLSLRALQLLLGFPGGLALRLLDGRRLGLDLVAPRLITVPPNVAMAASMISGLGSVTTASTAFRSVCTDCEMRPSVDSIRSASSRSNSEPIMSPVEPPSSTPTGPPRMPTRSPTRPPPAVPASSSVPIRSLTARAPSDPRWTTTASWISSCPWASSSLSLVRAPYASASCSNVTAITL